jgi:hypothetical protein
MTDGCCCYPRDYTMECSLTGMEKRSTQPHLVESLQKMEVEGAASIHHHSVELDVFYNGVDYQRIPPRLWYKVWVGTAVEGNGDLGPSKVLGVVGPTAKASRAVSFCFILGSYDSGPPKI